MSNDACVKGNSEFERAVNACTDASQLQHDIARNFFQRESAAPEPPDVPLPASGFKFEREIRFDPKSGKRTLVIRANSEADLDALEAQILNY